jgi:GGDEF domain-containing protein
MSQRPSENTRGEETDYRHGGDEFHLLLTRIRGRAMISSAANESSKRCERIHPPQYQGEHGHLAIFNGLSQRSSVDDLQ